MTKTTVNPAFTRHIESLYACRMCPRMQGRPVCGAVPGAKVLLVGQAPGPREEAAGKPFAWTAGKKLFGWFERLGVSEETFRSRVYMAAVARCFPGKDATGGDRVPDPEEIAACGQHLDREIEMLRPRLVIAVGTLAAAQFLEQNALAQIVGRVHRVRRAGVTFDLVVLPHPSGRSTWTMKPDNAALLDRSLQLIREHPAMAKVLR